MKRLDFDVVKAALGKKPLVKVYSHPRSGTHLTEAFLGRNFYPRHQLGVQSFIWGHWSDRRWDHNGNPYGGLFGSHRFPDEVGLSRKKYGVYIVRDPRAVALSIWKTPNFLHRNHAGLTFSEFLRTPLDWRGSPASQAEDGLTIFEHWKRHVSTWGSIVDERSNLVLIRYEELLSHPHDVAQNLVRHFKFLRFPRELKIVEQPVGLLPNQGERNSFQEYFNTRDHDYFLSVIGPDNPYVIDE